MAWRGKLPHDNKADPQPPYIMEQYWPAMGSEIDAARDNIPLQLGAPLGNINNRPGTIQRRVRKPHSSQSANHSADFFRAGSNIDDQRFQILWPAMLNITASSVGECGEL